MHSSRTSRNAFTVDSAGNFVEFKFLDEEEMKSFAKRLVKMEQLDMIVIDGTNSELINKIG